MPQHPAELPPEVQQADAQMQDDTVGALTAEQPIYQTPQPAAKIQQLVSALDAAKEALGGGELPPIEAQLPQGNVDSLPPQVYAELQTMRAALDQLSQAGLQGTEAYDFDPAAAASTPEGLTIAATQLQGLARDKSLIEQLQPEKDMAEAEKTKGGSPEDVASPPGNAPASGVDSFEGLL